MKQFAVLHTEKGNISSGGIGNHIDRIKGAEHTYRHADPSKKNNNSIFSLHNNYHKKSLDKAIAERIKEGYQVKNKAGELKVIRKDAVKYCTHILSGSHEQMKFLENYESKENNIPKGRLLELWFAENYKFMCEEFGKENIVRFVMHLDEKTPHIHCVTVPLTKDGRLSAKEVIGNRDKMQKRQDSYAELMRPFGLERGIKNTGIKHEDAADYYKRIFQEGDLSCEISDLSDSYLGVNVLSRKKTESVLKTLKSLKNEMRFKEDKIDILTQKLNYREIKKKDYSLLKQKIEKYEEEKIKINQIKAEEYRKGQISIIENPELYQQERNILMKNKLKKAQEEVNENIQIRKGFRR